MNWTRNPSGHIQKALAIIGASVALSTLPGCTVFSERVESVMSVNRVKDALKELIQKTKISYNGKEHNFPNDAIIDWPDKDGIYTISSDKLKKVTRDTFRFDENLNFLTQQITIRIDSFDFLTTTIMQARFWIKDWDICSISYKDGVLHIEKI